MVMEALGGLQKALLSVGKGILDAVPGLLGAAVLLLVGYWIALAVEWAVEKGLGKLKADEYLMKKTGLNKSLGNLSLEWLAGLLAKWYVFVLFFLPAADVVKLSTFASFLKVVAQWVPTLIGASALGLFGVVAAGYVKSVILDTKVKSADLVANFVNVIILIVTALVVLKQVGLDLTVIENSLFIVLSGIMFALALALGLGFGLALKDEARGLVKDFLKKL